MPDYTVSSDIDSFLRATTDADARSRLGVDAAGTDNSTDVTTAGTGTYVSLTGQVLTVDPIDLTDLSATGTADNTTYLRGDNTWATVAGGGGGDMLAATYDPTTVEGDAFAMDNMVEGATTKILTATERSEIAANTAASHAAATSAGTGTHVSIDTGTQVITVDPITASDINAEASTDGQILTSDGAGAAAWEAAPTSGGTVQGSDGTYDIQATNEGIVAGGIRGDYSIDLQMNRSAAGNVASGLASALVGGFSNTASGDQSAVIGGTTNTASGTNSIVLAGKDNTASGNYSLAAGNAGNSGGFTGARVFADSSVTAITALAADTFNVQADALRLVDGNEGAGKVLTCDANGSGNWTTPAGGAGVAGSTGVLTGGLLTIGAPNTTFSISDGTGTIVDTTGAVTNISWSGQTNLAVTNLLTDLLTWVSINSSGTVVQRNVAFTADVRRTEVCLGVLVHVNNTNIDAINTEAVVAFNPHSTAHDLAASLGFINVSGNVFSANGANLNLNKSAGEIFYAGSNYDTSSTNPHVKTLPVLPALTFQYRFSDGSNGATGTAIDPDNLDDGAGGLTAVGSNRFSIQRITSFISNNVKIQRGVADYATLEDAVAGVSSEAFVTEPSLRNGLLRGWLVVKKGTTDLSNTSEAQFISAGKLGEVGGGGGSGAEGNFAVELGIAVSDETTDLTTGTAKGTFRMPYAMTVTDVRATVTTAPTGANIIVDINDGGTSIMTTDLLSIDATEKTSTTAFTTPNITDTALADDAEITIDIDQIGSTLAGAGLKIWIIGTRA